MCSNTVKEDLKMDGVTPLQPQKQPWRKVKEDFKMDEVTPELW